MPAKQVKSLDNNHRSHRSKGGRQKAVPGFKQNRDFKRKKEKLLVKELDNETRTNVGT